MVGAKPENNMYVKDIKEITYWHDYLGKKTKTKYDNNKLVIKPKLFNMNG